MTKRFFKTVETSHADSSCRLNIFVCSDCRGTKLLWVNEGRLLYKGAWISGKFSKYRKLQGATCPAALVISAHNASHTASHTTSHTASPGATDPRGATCPAALAQEKGRRFLDYERPPSP